MYSLVREGTGFRLELDNQQIISVEDLNLVINAFYGRDESFILNNRAIRIIPKKTFERVNVVFIAGLILLQKTYNCYIKLDCNRISDSRRIFELLQINDQNQLLYKNKAYYEISYISSQGTPHYSNNEKLNPFSRSFAPIFYINENNYLLLFDKEAYNNSGTDSKKGIEKILEPYLGEVKKLNKADIFQGKCSSLTYSPFFLLIFSILYFKIEPYKQDVQQSFHKTKEQLIESIIIFVQEYSDGIFELAKNIIQHSDKREGIISVRVYDDGEGNGNILENYVFDFGSKGIIETIKVKTTELLQESRNSGQHDICSDLQGDIDIINSGNYSLIDFVEPLVDNKSKRKILNQQIRREIAHFGLMQFCSLITSNKGSVSIGTENRNHDIESYSFGDKTPHTLAKGSSFFFQFPPKSIVGHEVNPQPVDNKEKQISSLEIDSFTSFYDKFQKGLPIILDKLSPVNIVGREFEQRIINDFLQKYGDSYSSQTFIVVDFRNIDGLSPAGFLRILATLPLKAQGKHMIVSNIPAELYLKAIENNLTYYRNKQSWIDCKNSRQIDNHWWIDNNQVLCYSFCTVSDGRDYYYADMLAGKSYEDFITINRLIHNTFDNAFAILKNASEKKAAKQTKAAEQAETDFHIEESFPYDQSPFFIESALAPFDIEIKTKSDQPIFINNLRLILNKEIERGANSTVMDIERSGSFESYLCAHFSGIPGYSISNTHFKIGSKIHAERYIYAKRLFNNSYYSSRLALCLAHKISQEDVAKDKTKSLSLLGYEQYSLAMLSLVKKYMENWGYGKVSVCHASTKDGKLEIKGPFDHSGDYIIVVPIVSTGSTSIAMVQAVNKKPVLYYHIVVTESGKSDFLANEFTADEGTKIRKIIGIITDWNETNACPYCFGNERKPLLEADKTNLNPLSIFNFPTTKKVSESEKFDLKAFEGDGILKYSVRKKPNGYYRLFSINTDSFINKNLNSVTKWLNDLRVKLQENEREDIRINPTDHIVILAPSSDTNTRFINIVNEHVFGSSATILYMQADEDYLENFKLLNVGLFQNINSTKVFFVDDELVRGSSFFKIYDLFRFTTEYNKELRLSGAIFLLNKASDQIYTRVMRASSNHLFSYMAINDQSLFDLSGLSPLDSERRKYESLASHSLNIDSRIYFQEKASSFNESITNSYSSEERHLCMFGITHSLYEYFGKFEDKEICADAIKEFQAISDINDLCRKIGLNKVDHKYELIKVLCNHPFVMYYDILCKTFELQNKMLADEISVMDTSTLTDQRIKHILFLIRRAVLIKNYYIISKDFFIALSKLFDAIKDRDSDANDISSNLSDKEDRNLFSGIHATTNYQADFSGMPYYLLRRYAEIINQNGWCAKQISDNIESVEFKTEQGKLFKSLLKIEISSVMNNYYDALEKQQDWRGFSVINSENSLMTINDIKTHREQIDEKLTLNDKNTREMAWLLVSDEKSDFFDTFIWLKKFFSDDENRKLKVLSLSEKIEEICTKIKSLFHETRVGLLFVVVDNRDKYHIVYDRDIDNCNRFTDSYNVNKDDFRDLFAKLLPECNRKSESGFKDSGNRSLFFDKDEGNDRMTLRVYHNDNLKPVCFLSIYGTNVVFSNDIDAQRMLSLIASDLDSFVGRHHQNDEFISLVEAESEKRLSYLMGHGRNTIKRLSEEKPELFQDMSDIQEYMQFLYYRKMKEWPFMPNLFDEGLINSLIDDIKEYVKIIYASKNVEYDVCLSDCDIKVFADSNSKDQICGFNFNARLIKYICFELIINAKKNRFLFIGQEKERHNFITIKFAIEVIDGKSPKREMNISVSSSGPVIPKDVLNSINGGRNVKGSDSPSGLRLINWIIDKTNSDRKRNYIYMTSVQQEDCPYFNNTVVVTIPTVE